jgi:hypothetical protein
VPKLLHLKCQKNLKSRNIKCRNAVHYLQAVLAGATKNETKMQEYVKLRNLKPGIHCRHEHMFSS